MKNFVIDDSFIEKWCREYDEIEHDEKEYQEIIRQLKEEIIAVGTISEETARRLLKWKKARRATKLIMERFAEFAEVIKKCLKIPEDEKLKILDDLPGIGVPVGSTLLHFIFPNKFPIMDIRTVEVLYAGDYIKSKSRDASRYTVFKDAIFLIHRRLPKWTLRQIDRALFAFHKKELSKKPKDC